MSLEWDSRVIAVEGVDTSKSPRRYTFKVENFCPHCKCPRSHVEKLNKISKKILKPANQFLIKHLADNNFKLFETKDLIKSLNAEYLTDGSFQNKQMTLLVLKGLYRRDRQEFIQKKITKKEEKEIKKFKWIYVKNWNNEPPKCYDSLKDSHISILKNEWEKTTYFDDKANRNEEVGVDDQED